METNERFVKLSGKVPYTKDIKLSEDITVKIGEREFIANCVKISEEDQQDGTMDRIFILKSTLE